MNKLFFFDIDGTLLRKNNESISKKTKYAVEQLVKQGNIVYVATGKSIADANRITEQLGIDLLISSNGQVISNNGKIISGHYFPNILIKEVTKIAKKNNYLLCAQTNFNNYILNLNDEVEEKFKKKSEYDEMIEFLKYVSIPIPTITKDFQNIKDITQFWLIGNERESFNNTNVKIFPWVKIGNDLIMKNADKVNAVKQICSQYPDKLVYAFGDGYNDIKMLKYADIGIAMGNSSLEVKSIANEITSSVDDEGVYEYLVKNEIIEEL